MKRQKKGHEKSRRKRLFTKREREWKRKNVKKKLNSLTTLKTKRPPWHFQPLKSQIVKISFWFFKRKNSLKKKNENNPLPPLLTAPKLSSLPPPTFRTPSPFRPNSLLPESPTYTNTVVVVVALVVVFIIIIICSFREISSSRIDYLNLIPFIYFYYSRVCVHFGFFPFYYHYYLIRPSSKFFFFSFSSS